MRRAWRDAMPKGATVKNSKAAVGYNYCNKLFALERKWKNLNNAQREENRRNQAEKLVDEYFLWVRSVDPVSGSKLEDAVKYALNQEKYLRAFLNNGEVEISNNFAENAIRPFVIGRKNWLFSDTVKGSQVQRDRVQPDRNSESQRRRALCLSDPCVDGHAIHGQAVLQRRARKLHALERRDEAIHCPAHKTGVIVR